jgi:ATP-dependent DNA helicase RecG
MKSAGRKQNFKPRDLMERTVRVMRNSVAEPRADEKPSPLVGALLVKPDGTIDTAFRGELRQGDHAEYTLLERKHREERLDGSFLFTTLEPCAPGARKHPKLPCAERIVNARITKVWVGIEDPDPSVDRKGIKYLEEHGVNVHMFDPDLQTEIRKVNKSFLAEAAKRAALAKTAPPAEVIQSRWEQALSGATRGDFAGAALGAFKKKIGRRAAAKNFDSLLSRQGFLTKFGQRLVPTGFGYLLFAAAPRDLLPQAGLKATIEYPDHHEEVEDFDGPLLLIPDRFERWLRNKLPFVSNRSAMERKDSSDVPFELIREGVINALVHRDYDIQGATCHVIITADTITVRSPGPPPSPVLLEQLQAFNAPMLNRNPKLQFAFGGAKLAEGRGLGMKTLGAAAEKYHLPLPKYSFDGVYLTLTIYRNSDAVIRDLDSKVLKKLSKSEESGWQWLATRKETTSTEYATALEVPNRTALNHLKRFTVLGLLSRMGSGPATRYRVVRK